MTTTERIHTSISLQVNGQASASISDDVKILTRWHVDDGSEAMTETTGAAQKTYIN
jgi:hypothetical protein